MPTVVVAIRQAAVAGILASFAASGSARAAATVTVATSPLGIAVSGQIRGANMAQWFDPTQPGVGASLLKYGFTATRWPGGSDSDMVHWKANTACGGAYINPNATFDKFVQSVVRPAKLDLAVTLNYGSNAACDGGGDPAEAAAWVAYAKAKGYKVSHWTVGNEVYGNWEYDLHKAPHDPATYAAAVANGYYPQIKAANPAAQVGVVVNPYWYPDWDSIVLAKAKYDFVEFHWYPETPGQESDSYLIDSAPTLLPPLLARIQSELASAGHKNTPIYVGELGSVYSNPGKQTTSITQALFAGEVLTALVNAGIPRATWWLGHGGCGDASTGNFSSTLYGWQNFSGYMLFSDGTPEYGCPSATTVPLGTPLPSVRAFQLMAQVARSGEHVLKTKEGGTTTGLRVLAVTHGKGYAVFLINLNETKPIPMTISVPPLTQASSIQVLTYGKAQYDKSKTNVWASPAGHFFANQKLPFKLTLPQWSMAALILAP